MNVTVGSFDVLDQFVVVCLNLFAGKDVPSDFDTRRRAGAGPGEWVADDLARLRDCVDDPLPQVAWLGKWMSEEFTIFTTADTVVRGLRLVERSTGLA